MSNNKKNKKENIPQQMTLFGNIPIAKSQKNRALSKEESDLILAIRYHIQEELLSGRKDPETPLSFSLDLRSLAKEKNLSRLSTFKRHVAEAVDTISKHVPAETIVYTDKKGVRQAMILPMVMGIQISEYGDVNVKTNPDYQQYYMRRILLNPDLRVNKQFYLNLKSKYGTPLSDWIIGSVAERRLAGEHSLRYELIASLDEVKKSVPPATNLSNANYIIKVIRAAVNDINNNPHSQIRIVNDDFAGYSHGKKMDSIKLVVEITPNEKSIFIPHSDENLERGSNVPNWDYIDTKLLELKVNKNYLGKTRHFAREQVWKALMYTWMMGKNAAYFVSALEKNYTIEYTIEEMAEEIRANRPVYFDNVLDSIIGGANQTSGMVS